MLSIPLAGILYKRLRTYISIIRALSGLGRNRENLTLSSQIGRYSSIISALSVIFVSGIRVFEHVDSARLVLFCGLFLD